MNKFKKYSIRLLILLLLFPAILNAQSNFIKDSLDTYINREMQRWNIPGVAVSVVKDGKVIYEKGFGVRELGKPEKVDENTLFMIASNTKAYTATAIALLESENRLSINDKVTKYMKDFKLYDELASKEVTIRDLLCHRIGFQTFQSDFLNWGCNLSRKELIHNMRNVKPMYSFRSRYGYTNMGFVTAGEIIPIVTDTSWDDFLKYNIFVPLKMNRTTTHNSDIVKDNNAAKPYTMYDNKLAVLNYDNVDNLGPCGGINSCVKDISNWIIMQLDSGRFDGRQVIPFSAINKTRTSNMIISDRYNVNFPTKHFQTYGLGWVLEDYEGRKIVSHDGGADGFVTNTTLVPEEGFGFTILTNTDANWFYVALQQQLIDYILKVPYRNISEMYYSKYAASTAEEESGTNLMRAAAAKKPKPSLELKAYAGKYSNEVYGEIEIKEEKGALNVYFSHHPQLIGKLEPLGENNFICNYSPVTYGIKNIPFHVKDDKVESVIIKVNDEIDYLPYEFTKIN